MSYSSRSRPRCCIIQQKNTDGEQCRQYKYYTKPKQAKSRKSPEDCFLAFIDQLSDGLYSSSKLVRAKPRSTKDQYTTLRSTYTNKTEARSIRRHSTHRSIALFRTKKLGSTRANIEYMTCSLLELDGSIDGTIKTRKDVFSHCNLNGLTKPSYVIETSKGHFHVLWIYNNPLPWTEKNESYWMGQQKRLIELFKRGGFFVDKGASLNPCQNLRNPSQLKPYNFKRRCEVIIDKTFNKTSLRSLYNALNTTSVPNPKRLRASIKLRRFLRANKTFTLTYQELADALGVSLRTVKREVEKAISNGDMFSAGRVGNNKGIKRATRYESGLYLEPRFSEVPHSISKAILSGNQAILARFQTVGAAEGWRNKTLLACSLYLKSKSRRTVTLGELVDALDRGRRLSGITEREFIRTIKNALKSNYKNPLSMSKLREWGLLQETMDNSKYHNIPLH